MDNSIFNNKHIEELAMMFANKDGSVDEKNCRRIISQLTNERRLTPIREKIITQYTSLAKEIGIQDCSHAWKKDVSFSLNELHKACYEIEADIRILLSRRKNLIGTNEKTGISHISRGKIAGVTTYRLSRAHIIHLSSICLECNEKKFNNNERLCKISVCNTEFAIICGLYFINKEYSKIQKEIRDEIIYTLTHRHTNQETLGIIFDTLKFYT